MSKYLSSNYEGLIPYVPGEQPQDQAYIKLNTNESPFPPSPIAQRMARQAAGDLELYSDPDVKALVNTACDVLGLEKDEILFFNGSDEALVYCFMAFCDEKHPACFADITYGFYKVAAGFTRVPYETIPLKSDFSVDTEAFAGCQKNIFLANPNAPTGIVLPLSDVEKIIKGNPSNVVIVDEAYVDFGGESALNLIRKYDNLIVIQTFSKSRSLAGGRLGFAAACPELIKDLNNLRYSSNPYNVNRMTMAAGIGALIDREYFEKNLSTIIQNREWTSERLKELGFELTDSKTNFVFAKKEGIGGRSLYLALKERGILVRHFDSERTRDYIRVTIGSKEQMEAFINTIKELS